MPEAGDHAGRHGVVIPADGGGVVGSEFAEVEVGVDTDANGVRLRLLDRRTGRVRFLDALELETLVWLPDGHLQELLDPSAHRWREESGH
ncbi:hypothetical protein SLNWT_0067 [Streptomyces albus]|uniref:Dihydrodiol dehydrogenase n=1 Tax=Streptomyces albus (strain ATCC 21838 / DSM 41398 / FERM P-419 / JCM 4703 / NBRC 107858) TaxID=1081613 RepID=A0A0B5EES1_STRA4|nr:hypothetical protein SLNWT_0067 [Streptomyces albus]AOU74758.1 hypothetical protein SLNHY_0067 [Streptomyces albus]AYN30569.1 hypothetical protein DUI70_0066 [Streptomyces albus]